MPTTLMEEYSKEEIATLKKQYKVEDSRTWPFYPIQMTLDEKGRGPVPYSETDTLEFEVWDRFFNSYESFPYLYDAIDFCIDKNNKLFEEV